MGYGPVRRLIRAGGDSDLRPHASRLNGHRSEGTYYARNRNLPTFRRPNYREIPITLSFGLWWEQSGLAIVFIQTGRVRLARQHSVQG